MPETVVRREKIIIFETDGAAEYHGQRHAYKPLSLQQLLLDSLQQHESRRQRISERHQRLQR